MKNDNRILRNILGGMLITLAAAGMYMSWGALYDAAILCGFTADKAVVFPAVIDLVTVVAMLIGLHINSPSKSVAFYPWAALIVFGTFTIIGNAMGVLSSPPGSIRVDMRVAIVAHSMPSIAFLVTTHLVAVTVYRKKPLEAAVASSALTSSEREAKRPVVLALAGEGKSVREIEHETGVPRSTAARWIERQAVGA